MDTQPQPNQPHAKQPSGDESSLSLNSGTGAPIFEPGPHTRIRRNPVRAIAAVTWEDGPREIFGQILNISLTGCLLRTETTIAEGTELTMKITLIGDGQSSCFDVRTTVQRETTIRDRKAYGLEFTTECTEEKQSVQALYSATAH